MSMEYVRTYVRTRSNRPWRERSFASVVVLSSSNVDVVDVVVVIDRSQVDQRWDTRTWKIVCSLLEPG